MHDLNFVISKYNMDNSCQLNINSMIRGRLAIVEVSTVREEILYSYEEEFTDSAGDAISRCKSNIAEQMYKDGIR